ncbi:hypothetical protein COCON_G00234330 [Conger conger]|uniref:Ig-like domain-containing protein n=1 Tax=Conger conger TaxID=82655 RepID=A0A9Q1CUU5_CONCO|nr:hypothetical protein COCON_G00234330 [Conger conger]
MGMVLWWTLLWILRYCHTLSAEVLVQHKYFIYGEDQGVSLQAPAEPKGKEFIWEWTPHDGRYRNAYSATLAWERDREPTANTTLIYNNTAHIIIHSVDQHSEGTYDCTLRRNGALIFSVPNELKVLKVSVEPPGGLSRNQPVVLNCEISQVIESVTLAWLRMKGDRGELVKQEVLTKRSPKTMLSLTLPSLTEDQLHWACVVFTGSVLRAQVPLHLTLPETPITDPEKSEEGWSTETVVRVVIVALATLGMLLVLRCLRPSLTRAAKPCRTNAMLKGHSLQLTH